MSAISAAPRAPELESEPRSSLDEAIQKFNQTLTKQKHATDAHRAYLTDRDLTVDGILEFGTSIISQWNPKKDDKKLKNVNKFLKALLAYGPIIEVFIRPVPAVKSVIWGGVKFILSVGTTYLDRLDDLAKAFEDLEDWLPIVLIYQRRATQSNEIQTAVRLFQESLVEFFTVLIDNPTSTGLVQALFPGFNNIKASREKLERAARNTAATVTAVEHDLQDRAREEDKRLAFLKWLYPHPTSQDIYNRAKRFQLPKTFSSIFNSTEFGSWLEYKEGPAGTCNTAVLQVVGSEHCGKSTVAAAFVDQIPLLFQNETSLLCPLFIEQDTSQFPRMKRYFCAALREIFKQRPELLTKELIARYYDPAAEHLSDPTSLFKEIASQCSPLYFLLDGFDPSWADWFCDDAHHYSKGSEKAFSLRIIMFLDPAPTPYDHRPENLPQDESPSVFSLNINSDCIKEDMSSFVWESAKTIAMNCVEGDSWPNLAADIGKELMKGTTNNFLLMQTSLDYIRRQPSERDVRVALKSLSPDIKDMFLKILTQISAYQDGRTYLAVEMMKALLSSFRPLSLRELAELVVIEPGSTAIDETRRYRGQTFGSAVQSLCGPLFMIEQQDGQQVVRTSSLTGKEFMMGLSLEMSGKKVLFLSDTDSMSNSEDAGRKSRQKLLAYISKDSIFRKCISYLSFSCFSGLENSLPAVGDKEGWLNRFPFFDYASNCWLNHLFDLADHMKNPYLSEGSNWARPELWFDKDLLEILATFLASPNSWTYLEGLLLFSSARKARETLAFCRYPIAETETWMGLWDERIRPDQPNARILEEWALGTYDFLGDMENLAVEDALQAIRLSRQAQIVGIGPSLLENGKALKIAGFRIGEAGPGAEKYRWRG